MSDDGFFSAAIARAAKPLPSLIPRCGRCGLKDAGCHTPMMPHTGGGKTGVLLVSDYPGKEEDRAGRPFVGRTGRWMSDLVQTRLKLSVERDFWLTNAQICYDIQGKNPKTVVEDCRPNLLKTISTLNPRVVVLMGNSAVSSLIGHLWGKADTGKVSRWFGFAIPARTNYWVCPTWNPAHVTRQEDDGDTLIVDLFAEHLKTAVEFASGDRPWPDGHYDPTPKLRLCPDPEEAAELLDTIESGTIAFDYETNCIKPDAPTSKIVCASVCCNGEWTVSFPWAPPAIRAFKRVIEDPKIVKVGWSAKFEDRWTLAKLGTQVRGWCWDGMLAQHCLLPRKGTTGLKFQAFVRMGVPDFNSHIEPLLDSGKDKGCYAPNKINEIDIHSLLKYCATDSQLEYEICYQQMQEVRV